MKVLIIEDEKAAVENLRYLLSEIEDSIQIEGIVDSVKDAIRFFEKGPSIELVFMDIHLADGISFEIFKKVKVDVPIIFTTAYDEYAIQAFKVKSIDYLLKPIDGDELREAVHKFKQTQEIYRPRGEFQELLKFLKTEKKSYKTAYLVQQRDTLIPLSVKEIAYFVVDTGLVKAVTFLNKGYLLDRKLEDIESEIDPDRFFRVNRQYIVQRSAIQNLQLYFNGKLILNIDPRPEEKIVVSKAKAPKLKLWMN
ncbi:LytTR family DNA-binding domain-containing protein [Muricauda sp. SCSIO 64092]|uniref:LytR/AlgR family response regulator transcription factor n=1 Tax=Allomuricauda sp. SCSIO 64092 TaxID=2908842 RepID=UPI001FF107C7|nr:LytTR family DNA-binding domain-containing protein [Muricauda sp. SCSIO 64092]UOY06180.1 LytTR family DNA-binding domain-containing protein [Muricauda sp. SCSIO 64092]